MKALFACGDEDKSVAVTNDDVFLLRPNEFVLFPFAKDTANVIDISACHFCYVLAGDNHVDEHAFAFSFAKLPCQP